MRQVSICDGKQDRSEEIEASPFYAPEQLLIDEDFATLEMVEWGLKRRVLAPSDSHVHPGSSRYRTALQILDRYQETTGTEDADDLGETRTPIGILEHAAGIRDVKRPIRERQALNRADGKLASDALSLHAAQPIAVHVETYAAEPGMIKDRCHMSVATSNVEHPVPDRCVPRDPLHDVGNHRAVQFW
jgi:hypothetical protein